MKIENLKLKIKSHLPIIIFLILYLLIIAYKLISHPTPFYDWDEAINVQVAKETIEKISLVPLWQGKAWLDKPPLPFLFFGFIIKLTPFLTPEISLRLISLLLSLISLILVYAVYLKALNGTSEVEEERSDGKTSEVNKVLALLTIIIISFTPIFLQRSQIVNLDVFLLIGWLGYLLFVQNFWLSLFFLTVGVLTKSLLAFYPAGIILGYNFFILFKPPRLKRNEVTEKPRGLIKQILIQIGILSLWYLLMFIFFGKDFWQQHIIETHFRRVTASIESHFGQRTYYLDLMFEQLGIFAWFSIIGLLLVISKATPLVISSAARNLVPIKSGRKNYEWILYFLFLFPWFIFLNLTKTKIFWYLYPAIPQFAFLSVYPLFLLSFPRKRATVPLGKSSNLLNRFPIRSGMTIVAVIIIIYIFYQNFIKTNFFTTFYSKPEDYYRLALYAKDRCDSLTVLVGKETREANKTLENLGLTITSSKQWGDHPSLVYYFGKKVDFVYNESQFQQKLSKFPKNNCLLIRNNDLDLVPENKMFKQLKNLNSYYLFKR